MFRRLSGWQCVGRLLLCLVLAGNVTTPVRALSSEQEYIYAQNNILFYDPTSNACSAGGIANSKEVDPSNIYISGNDNASGVIGTLMNNGYSKEAAAAIAGNLQGESSMNPRLLEGGAVVSENFRAWDGGKTFRGGFGLVQWTTNGRVEKLQNYADKNGMNVTAMQVQVGFLLQELDEYGITPAKLNAMSLEEATFYILRYYESPASVIYSTHDGVYYNDYVPKTLADVNATATPAAYKELNRRYGYAQQFLGITPTDLPQGTSTSSGSYVNCVPYSYSGDGSPISIDGVISFLQCDPAWKDLRYGAQGVNGSVGTTICRGGCGPTSFASIAATLGLSVDPVMTADVAGKAGMYVQDQGSSWEVTRVLAEYFNLSYEPLQDGSVEYINSLLRAGKMIHTAGGGSMPFTTGGHYIAIVGLTGSGEWIVADSGHGADHAVETYSPQQVLAGMRVASARVVWR